MSLRVGAIVSCHGLEGDGMDNKPNPGSNEAIDQGCLCPVLDNGHGKGYLDGVKDKNGKTVFVINCVCPLHGVKIHA